MCCVSVKKNVRTDLRGQLNLTVADCDSRCGNGIATTTIESGCKKTIISEVVFRTVCSCFIGQQWNFPLSLDIKTFIYYPCTLSLRSSVNFSWSWANAVVRCASVARLWSSFLLAVVAVDFDKFWKTSKKCLDVLSLLWCRVQFESCLSDIGNLRFTSSISEGGCICGRTLYISSLYPW